MSGRKTPSSKGAAAEGKPVSLRTLAESLALSPATISLVLNDAPAARGIPASTRQRIVEEAQRLNYRPNFFARSLRRRHSLTIGILVPEISEGYTALVLRGVEEFLLQSGYFYVVASHHHRVDLISEYTELLLGRSVDGFILIDTHSSHLLPAPAVNVSGHQKVRGITNIVVDHRRAAAAALEHLTELGHRRIAIIRGQAFSSDSEVRWKAIRCESARLGLRLEPSLVVQLKGEDPSPELGYRTTRTLLSRGRDFTALFAFNDISAIGAVRALREHGLRVPDEVSVVGFDDIQSAAYQTPALTTVRQPLRRMGEIAAEVLLNRIEHPQLRSPREIKVAPELVVRESTKEVVQSGELVGANDGY